MGQQSRISKTIEAIEVARKLVAKASERSVQDSEPSKAQRSKKAEK